MDLEDLDVKTKEVEDGMLKAVVEFPEESDSGHRIHTDWVVRQVQDQGYDVLSYAGTDTLEDEPGKKKKGTWKFEIPRKKGTFQKELEEVKGIGPQKAEKLADEYTRSELMDAVNKKKSIPRISTKTRKKLKVHLTSDE